MMRVRPVALLMVLATALFPVLASAQSARISATGANRMALDIWPSNGWVVSQSEDVVEIRFPQFPFEIVMDENLRKGLPGVLQEIEIERGETDTYLRLKLDCACQLALAGDGNSEVSLVVLETSPERAARSASDGPDPLTAPKPRRKPGLQVAEVRSEEVVDVDAARTRLMEQLMRAAEIGIVELDPAERPEVDAEEDDVDIAGEAASAEQSLPSEPRAQDAISAQPLGAEPVVETVELTNDPGAPVPDVDPEPRDPVLRDPSLEAAEAASEVADVIPPHAPRCFEEAAFTFPEAIGASTFPERLAIARADLLGEFDVPDSSAGIALSRVYLGEGLAEEASAIAAKFAPALPEAQLLQEIAAVLLGNRDGPSGILRTPNCVGDQALWRAVLLANEGEDDEALQAEMVSGRALERLPLRLREAVAALLGHAAANTGTWETARRLEAMAARAAAGSEMPSGNSLLLSARLAEWRQSPDAAWDLLQRARRTPPPYGNRALIELAEAVLRSEAYLTADTRDLQLDLGALAREARGTALGAHAFELEARLASRSQSRDDIVNLLSEAAGTGMISPEDQVSLLSDLIRNPAQKTLSRPLGLIYLDDPDRFAGTIEQPEFRRSVIRSLAELGLPALADPLLRPEDMAETETVAPLASAHLETGDARRAMDLAVGLEPGGMRDVLMAAALAQTGETGQSADVLQGIAPDVSRQAVGIRALERAMNSAIVAGELESAASSATKLLEIDPGARRAEELVILALMDGAPAFPEAAREVLDALDPGRAEQLSRLFQPLSRSADLPEQERAAELLDLLETEMSLLQGLLADG